jgi:hypothetical protein
MKKLLKLVLVAIPALAFVATVGLATMACDDDTGTGTPADLSGVVSHPDLATHGG